VLPGGAGGGAEIARLVGAEEFVGFHGQCGEAMARAFKQSGRLAVRSGDVGPEGLFLKWIEQEAAVERALFPGGAGEGPPVENVGRGPGGVAFGLAGAVEGGGEGASGAVAGGDYQTGVTQPLIDLGSQFCPHAWVIRRWAGRVPLRNEW